MRTIANNSYRFTSLALLAGALLLSGCTPVYVAAPQPRQIPQAMPMPRPPVQQQPRYVDVPPALDPAQEQQQVVPRRLPVPVQRPQATVRQPRKPSQPVRKPSQPSVSYIPDKPKTSSVQKSEPAPSANAEPTTKPFWDQGKVEVEILDMKKPSSPAQADQNNGNTQSGSTDNSSAPSVSISGSSSSPAVVVLMKQANNELVAGKSDRAAATLERALRIAPDDANLWLRLAEVNAQQGNKSQAASMARKAMTLAPGDSNIIQRSQRLLD